MTGRDGAGSLHPGHHRWAFSEAEAGNLRADRFHGEQEEADVVEDASRPVARATAMVLAVTLAWLCGPAQAGHAASDWLRAELAPGKGRRGGSASRSSGRFVEGERQRGPAAPLAVRGGGPWAATGWPTASTRTSTSPFPFSPTRGRRGWPLPSTTIPPPPRYPHAPAPPADRHLLEPLLPPATLEGRAPAASPSSPATAPPTSTPRTWTAPSPPRRRVHAGPEPGRQLHPDAQVRDAATVRSQPAPGRVVDLNGNTTSVVYGANGEVASVTDAAGRSLTFAYSASNLLTTLTDAAGRQFSLRYDANHYLQRVTLPAPAAGRRSPTSSSPPTRSTGT